MGIGLNVALGSLLLLGVIVLNILRDSKARWHLGTGLFMLFLIIGNVAYDQATLEWRVNAFHGGDTLQCRTMGAMQEVSQSGGWVIKDGFIVKEGHGYHIKHCAPTLTADAPSAWGYSVFPMLMAGLLGFFIGMGLEGRGAQELEPKPSEEADNDSAIVTRGVFTTTRCSKD